MKFTEKMLKSYAAPLSSSEEERCKNAIKMVRDAMKLVGYSDGEREISLFEEDTFSYSLGLKADRNREIVLLVQGSYANNTNVRTHSDVDVAVILESTFIPMYRSGITMKDYGFSDGTFSVLELKDDVEKALNQKFKKQGIKRNDKSIKVTGNSYRVDADVVPAYRLRDYRGDYLTTPSNYVGGIEIRPDSGGQIRNFPEQHISNGKGKNKDTNYYFKKHVRILKKIRMIMKENGYDSAENVSSFGLESLLWNVPDVEFLKYSIYRFTFDELIKYLVKNKNCFVNFKEANGIKNLFEDENMEKKYINFVDDLAKFYEYDIEENV